MSCAKYENDIALHAGGDLPAERAARVELHLAECAGCRAAAEEFRESQTLLAELRDEPLAEAMVAQVRQRVLAEVRGTRFSLRGAFFPLAACAAALLLVMALVWPRHTVRRTPAAPLARVEIPETRPAPGPKIVPVRHRLARRKRRPQVVLKSAPPLLVQFVTDDPNIVIYWLVDQKQGD